MKALLLVAHGSRVESSNNAVVELVTKLRPQLAEYGFDAITHAFLELTTPTIQEGIQALVGKGADQLVVLPYFLAPGTHVIDDLPELMAVAKGAHPEVSFTVMPHLGGFDGIIDLILDSARSA